MTGRPSDFTQAKADAICELLAEGLSLRMICEAADMPSRQAVFRWLEKHESFRDQYARAREFQADAHADEVTYIADTEQDAARARVRIDARKWAAGKQRPKKYGDKLDLNHGGSVEQVHRIERKIVCSDNRDG